MDFKCINVVASNPDTITFQFQLDTGSTDPMMNVSMNGNLSFSLIRSAENFMRYCPGTVYAGTLLPKASATIPVTSTRDSTKNS